MSQAGPPSRFDRQVRYARILGLLFAAIGFAVIGFGWNGAAREALVDKQFPYLISGGVGGLALVMFGGVLLLMAQLRSERAKLAAQIEEMGSLVSKAAAAPAAEAGTNGRVVAGSATYHRSDCRLVQGKSDLDVVPVEVARERGLSACRVCNPNQADRGARRKTSSGGRRRRKSAAGPSS